MRKLITLYLLILPLFSSGQSEMVPFDHVLTNDELIELLDSQFDSELEQIQSKYLKGQKEEALKDLTSYFKEKFSERYFFNWKNFDSRFHNYNESYSGRKEDHLKTAHSHMDLYPAYTLWKIPFDNKKGEEVSSYPYRHLTRQHKAGDIGLSYHYTKNIEYLNYIPEQARSLNQAFDNGLVESIKDGNGAYEVYRAGNRMFNWLFTHQILLASEEYSSNQQLEMIKCFLHTAAQIHHYNQKYNPGNHQTRGMSALAMLSFLFPEIKGSIKWKNLSLEILEEHLEREIYKDGFQFERSVHYHISDIKNYFLPFQLARINNIELNPIWETRIFGLFDVIAKISFPDRSAPVLQDDTNSPWAESNEIGEPMALGAILFSSPEFNYFAAPKVSSDDYWLLSQNQLNLLKSLEKKKPETGSVGFNETGYFIMREGWDTDDLFMVVSSGLSSEKPDHQHGDMLGLQAYSHGKVILPNYQVRYFLEDLIDFKNSWTKSVILIDSIPQGREWKGNKGGSGFGKWERLPQPEVISWYTSNSFDSFSGRYKVDSEAKNKCYRSVFFIKGEFWIVKDQVFSEEGSHSTQQVWQGHYDVEDENRSIRSVFFDGGGLEIIQLGEAADRIYKNSIRGKGRSVFEKEFQKEFEFITLLHPYKDFDDRLEPGNFNGKLNSWNFSSKQNPPENMLTNADQIIYNENKYLLIGISELEFLGTKLLNQDYKSDLWIVLENNKMKIFNCGINKVNLFKEDKEIEIEPGSSIII